MRDTPGSIETILVQVPKPPLGFQATLSAFSSVRSAVRRNSLMDVRHTQLVSISAMCAAYSVVTENVLVMRHGFHMCAVEAPWVATQMIDLLARRHRSVFAKKNGLMRHHVPALKPDPCPTVPIETGTDPPPTRRSLQNALIQLVFGH